MFRALSTEDLQTLLGIAKRTRQAEAALAAATLGSSQAGRRDGSEETAGKALDAGVLAGVLSGYPRRRWRGTKEVPVPWKEASLRFLLERATFSGKPSTPYAPGVVHDYMHAKVTVADDTVFIGSFNLSHSGEENAENVLEIEDPKLADRMAVFVDSIRSRYPALTLD